MKACCALSLSLLLLCLAACSKNKGPSCSFKNSTSLAATSWPKFLADVNNSGRSGADLSGNDGHGGVLFSTNAAGDPIGPTETTPVLGNPPLMYVGSADTNVYIADYTSGEVFSFPTNLQVMGPVTGTPLLGADETLFVPTNGALAQFDTSDLTSPSCCTEKSGALLPGFAAASPNIWDGDGTTYVGTLSGNFAGICPNGVSRYQISFPITQSAAAIALDPLQPTKQTPIIVAAGLGGIVRAYDVRGRQRWSFSATATIIAGVLIDPSTDLFYVADSSGRVSSGTLLNGTANDMFNGKFRADTGITATPVLGRDNAVVPSMYVIDNNGKLYALDRATGAVRWTFQADGPVSGSPAVATGGAADIIVFGADIFGVVDTSTTPVAIGGRVYAIRDDGVQGTLLWQHDTDSIGKSSPSINFDGTVFNGTVYIGRSGLRIGSGEECPSKSGTCQVSEGGGVYAFGPNQPADSD